VAAFFSATGAALSQEVADGKINVQTACALNTLYTAVLNLISCLMRMFFFILGDYIGSKTY
jgi:hypothetical protein